MDKYIEYEIPISCLKRLTQQDDSRRFDFLINNRDQQFTIQTTINQARVISRKVNQIYQIDPTINEYELNIHNFYNINDIQDQINFLLKSTKEKIKIPENKSNIFSYIEILLGKYEDNKTTFKFNNITEAISFLSTELHGKSIEYLSKNLIQMIENGYFSKIEENISNQIIDLYFENPVSPDELNKIFTQLTFDSNERLIIHFLLQIEYQYYTYEMANYISSHLTDEMINDELGLIIEKFREQLLINFPKTIKNSNKLIDCSFKGNQLDGIISYLKKTLNTDLCKNGEIKISGGGDQSIKKYKISNLIEYDEKKINDCYYNYFSRDPNESDGWIEFDFGERKINLSSYTLRSCSDDGGYKCFAKSWRIVGSNDRKNWDVIDHQVNDSSLNGKENQNRFECKENNNYYQFIKYIQEDSTDIQKYYVFFTCIEFFGMILDKA